MSFRSIMIWRVVQAIVWLIGAGIVFCLIFYPATGINLFWNMLIPAAPFFARGVYRRLAKCMSDGH
jgi:hypothetical protein